jgi:pimeloyl-ACP methyl ester carboxylesterase
MRLNNQAVSIHVVTLNPHQPNALIYFGGNGELLVHRAKTIAQNHPNHTIYLMEYRGYGQSGGTPTQEGLYSDALALYDTIALKHQKISTIGRSLGSAMAIYLASKRKIHRLALITPFDSILHVAQAHYPIYPLAWMLRDTYEMLPHLHTIESESLIISVEGDHIVPNERTNALIQHFPPKKLKRITLNEGNHNNIVHQPHYQESIKRFINE